MRAGIRTAIPLDSPMHLRTREVTIAQILRQAGYATAHVGKWHLNGLFNQNEQPQPDAHGFELPSKKLTVTTLVNGSSDRSVILVGAAGWKALIV